MEKERFWWALIFALRYWGKVQTLLLCYAPVVNQLLGTPCRQPLHSNNVHLMHYPLGSPVALLAAFVVCNSQPVPLLVRPEYSTLLSLVVLSAVDLQVRRPAAGVA